MAFDASEVAARLAKAKADRTAIGSLSAQVDGFDLAAAYDVQRRLRSEAGPLAGWKLGLTSRAKQAQVGVSEPLYGFLAASDALDLGSPLVTGKHIQPRCEPEIVFVMGADLYGPSVTASAVLAATAAVAVGIEVLDSRYTDYKFTTPDVVADNTSQGRYVVGAAVPAAGLGFAAARGRARAQRRGGSDRVGGRVARAPGSGSGMAGAFAGAGERGSSGGGHRAVGWIDGSGAGEAGGRGHRDGGPARQRRTRLRVRRHCSGEGAVSCHLASRVSLAAQLPRVRLGSGGLRPARCEGVPVTTGTMPLGCGSSGVSARVAGRVVPVMHLIAFRRSGPGPLTTTMEHRGGC